MCSSLRHVQPESLPAPTTTNKWGITPLAFAAWRGDAARLAEVLAADGAQAQLAATDCDGWDALAFAVRGGCPTCVRLLCEAGAAVNAASARDGRTALHSAALAAGASCVAALLEAGADTAARDGLGRTALQYAQQRLAGELEAEARAPFQRPAEALLEAQKVAGLLRAAAEGLPFSRAPPREEQAAPAPAGGLAVVC